MDPCVDRDSGPAAASLDDDQHPWRKLPAEGSAQGWISSAAGGRNRPSSPLSLTGNLAERSSPSRLHFVAQNRRGLDRSGLFYKPWLI